MIKPPDEAGKTFVEMSDRIVVRNERGYDWIEGDPAFPDEIEVALYRRERTKDFDGHRMIESHRYRRVDQPASKCGCGHPPHPGLVCGWHRPVGYGDTAARDRCECEG